MPGRTDAAHVVFVVGEILQRKEPLLIRLLLLPLLTFFPALQSALLLVTLFVFTGINEGRLSATVVAVSDVCIGKER